MEVGILIFIGGTVLLFFWTGERKSTRLQRKADEARRNKEDDWRKKRRDEFYYKIKRKDNV